MENQNTAWPDWSLKDKVLFIILIVFLIVAIVNGMANAVANLRVSDPTFIQYPWLAIMVATIIPIISMAIKFASNFFEYEQSRKRYGNIIFSLTGISAGCFIALFAQIYTGTAVDYDTFGESNKWGTAFVLAQTLTEILAAAALALALEQIYNKYYPDTLTDNPKYIEAKRALKDHRAEHEMREERRRQVHGRIIELEALRQGYINNKIIEFISLRAKHIATMNAHKDT